MRELEMDVDGLEIDEEEVDAFESTVLASLKPPEVEGTVWFDLLRELGADFGFTESLHLSLRLRDVN
jgi:hypothetical protein